MLRCMFPRDLHPRSNQPRFFGAADTQTLFARYSFVPLLTFGTTNGARYSLRVNIAVASGSPLHVYVSGSKCNVRPVLYEMFAR